MVDNLTEENNLLFAVARNTCRDNRETIREILDGGRVDWTSFQKLAAYHEISPFAFSVLKEFSDLVPDPVLGKFKNKFFVDFARGQFLFGEFLRISEAFKAAGIPIVPIKGIALLADIYAQNPLRNMCDIDILVKEADIQRAKDAFLSLGYSLRLDGLTQEYWTDHQCHLQFLLSGKKMIFYVDMHFDLDFKRKKRDILPLLWERTRQKGVDGNIIELLSPEDTFFSLALHLRHFGNILNLKNVIDLALILKEYGDNFDWRYIIKESKSCNLCSTVCFLLLQAQPFLASPVPEFVWQELGVPEYKRSMMRKFISGNTFNLKDGQGLKNQYLVAHFLLYDGLLEPVDYIVNIPLEQFAKYYGLKPYESRTRFFYRNRLLFMPVKGLYQAIFGKLNLNARR